MGEGSQQPTPARSCIQLVASTISQSHQATNSLFGLSPFEWVSVICKQNS